MAKTAFSATKHDKSTLNSGNQYTKDDQMSIEALNNTIENSLYAVEKADTAVTSSNSAVSTANSANTKATNAVNTANTASTNANDAKTKSEGALATANTALSKSTEAVTTANSAISTANSANTKADNAVTTANSANTKADNAVSTSDEAKRIAQEALNSSTEGVGSQVTVGGEVVGVFDADSKVDKSLISPSNDTKPFDKIPFINSAGVMEVGTYVDFHSDNTTGNDYSTRLYSNGENKNAVKLPSGSGTLALTTDNVASATKATQDGDGKVISNTYLPLTAGSNKPLSGDLYIPSGKYIRANSSAVLGHSGSALNVGNPDLSMNLRASTISSNKIIPNANGTIDFGSSSNHWKDGYFKDSVILNSSSANRLLFKHNGNSVFDISKSGDGAYMYMWDYLRNYGPFYIFGGFENASGTTEATKKPFGYTQIRTKHTDSSGTEQLHDFLFDTNGGFHIPSGGALYFD